MNTRPLKIPPLALSLFGLLALVFLSRCGSKSAAATGDAVHPEGAVAVQRASAPAAQEPRNPKHAKRALIVAISQYKPESSWPYIHSINDIPLMQTALKAQGFEDVHVLSESAATLQGIVGAFRKYLIEPAQPGDVAVFHFSGHGQQITDDDGDEVDGYDEALVPYDAPRTLGTGSSYDGSLHLRDDTLHLLLQELRRKIGPQGNVVVFLDSCFSGTGTRGNFRGGAPPMNLLHPGHPGAHQEKQGGGFFQSRGIPAADEFKLAPYIVFSAARANQVDQEMMDPTQSVLVGPLSYAISRTLLSLRGATTYQNLFDQIGFEMRQQLVTNEPQIEGETNTKIFSGEAVQQAPFFPVAEVESVTEVTLPMGSMGGLMRGATVEIHKEGTNSPQNASKLASGKVLLATPFRAKVQLNRAVSPSQLEKGRAFVTRYAFGDLRMRVTVGDLGDAPLQSRVRAALAQVPSVELVDSNPEVLVELEPQKADRTGPRRVIVYTQTGTDILDPALPSTPDLAAKIADRMLDLARNRYLSRLRLDDPNRRYTFDVIPIAVSGCFDPQNPRPGECNSVEEMDIRKLTSPGQQLQLPVGTYFKIKVTPGKEQAYGAILDLLPDGQINVLWPPAGAEQFSTNGSRDLGASVYYRVAGRQGVEELLFVASREPINFLPFETSSRGRGASRGDLGPFLPLFDDLTIEARAVTSFSANEASIYSRRFTVEAPK
jgi:hypothetical protein